MLIGGGVICKSTNQYLVSTNNHTWTRKKFVLKKILERKLFRRTIHLTENNNVGKMSLR